MRTTLLACLLLAGCSGASPESPQGNGRTAEKPAPRQKPKDPAPPKEEDPGGLPAGLILSDYAENEVAAGQAHGGREIGVYGYVQRVEAKGGRATLVVVAKPNTPATRTIRCAMRPGDDEALARLKAGDAVAVRGRVKEYHLGDLFMTGCRLVP